MSEISETREYPKISTLHNDDNRQQTNATAARYNAENNDVDGKEGINSHPSPAANPPEAEKKTATTLQGGDGEIDAVKTDSSSTPSSSLSSQPQITFPNGRWVAWLNVLGSVMVCFVTLGSTQAFGAYQDFYTRVFLSDRTPSEISWIGSTQVCLMFFFSPISGKLFDEGYFTSLLRSSSVLYVFCQFMLSATKPHKFYQVFLVQGIGLGLSAGMMFLPSVSIVAHYFSVRRSLIMGIVIAGSSLGGIVMPILLNQLFNNSRVGFAWGVRSLAFICLGALLIANLTMKPRFPGRKGSSKEEVLKLLKKLLTDIPYLLAVAGLALVYWGLYFPFFYLQLFAVLHGINTNLAFYSITILNASSLVGRIVPNLIADFYGPMNVVIPASVCCGLLMFLMFAAKTVGGLIVFAILYGFMSGAILALTVPSVTAFADNVGEVGGNVFESFTLLVGNPIMGALLDAPRYTWHRAIIFSAVMILAGAVHLTTSRMLLAKRRGRWRV